MKRNLVWKLLMITVLGMLLVTGCSKNEEKLEKQQDGRGHLKIALYWFGENMDPAIGWNGWTLSRAAVGETLVTADENMNLTGLLADSWENIDSTTWKFHIRKGVTFHNGNPLTPESVKSSIERSIKLNERGESSLKLESIKTEGEYVIFKTKEPYGAFLANLSDPLFIIVDTSADTSKYTEVPIATGPYKVTGYKEQVSFEAAAYDNYWGGKPAAASLTVFNISDHNTRAMALQSGDIDIAQGIREGDIALFKDNNNYIIETVTGTRVEFLFMNTSRKPLNDKNIRLAVNSAVDYGTIAKAIGLHAVPVGAPYPPATPYGKELDIAKHDVQKAKGFLDTAGYKDTDGDGYVDKEGKNLELVLVNPSTKDGGSTAVSELVQAQLKQVGIKVTIKLVENKENVKDNSDFDLLYTNWQTVSTGDSQWFLDKAFKTEAPDNYGKYSNKELDEIINKLSMTFDVNERVKLTRQAAQIIINEGYGIYLISQANVNISSNKVKNMRAFPIDYYFLTKDTSVSK